MKYKNPLIASYFSSNDIMDIESLDDGSNSNRRSTYRIKLFNKKVNTLKMLTYAYRFYLDKAISFDVKDQYGNITDFEYRSNGSYEFLDANFERNGNIVEFVLNRKGDTVSFFYNVKRNYIQVITNDVSTEDKRDIIMLEIIEPFLFDTLSVFLCEFLTGKEIYRKIKVDLDEISKVGAIYFLTVFLTEHCTEEEFETIYNKYMKWIEKDIPMAKCNKMWLIELKNKLENMLEKHINTIENN